MLRGAVGRLWGAAGGVGDRRVLSGEIFLCTVEGCSEPPQQSTTFHGCHIKERGGKKKKKRKSLRGQSINSMQLQVQSHWTQSGTIPPLSGGRDTVRARPLRATAGICSLPVQSVHERHFHPTLRYCQYNSSETVSDFIAASLIVFKCLKLHRAH